MSLVFDRVTFTHDGAPVPLFQNLSLHCGPGWTGIAGANGSGKTTLLLLAMGRWSPDAGAVRVLGDVRYCAQRTDDLDDDVRAFLEACDGDAHRQRSAFAVDPDWRWRWSSLSHGERKRAQVGAASWRAPAVLLLDEPTNHIDEAGRRQLGAGLRQFRGTGVLVSHDRALLDDLCHQCVFVEPPTAVVRPGTYSEALHDHREAARAQMRRRDQLAAEAMRLRQEAARRTADAAQADRRRSKRGLARGDSDGRARIDLARVSGADGRAGALARQMTTRAERAQSGLAQLHVPTTYERGVVLPGAPSPRRHLLAMPAGELPMPDGGRLAHDALVIDRTARIAISGPNGVGKSTIVGHVLASIELEPDRIVYLPQELDMHACAAVIDRFRALSPVDQGRVLTIVSALGSRPPRLLASRQASPGEIRKLLLAMGAAREPHLIVMDEPTNHLDLPAVECLEEALVVCQAALLLVSHDERFLARVTRQRWAISGPREHRRLAVRAL